MPPGPRPTPSRLRVLRGETRPSKVSPHEPRPPVGVGPPPEALDPLAASIWNGLRVHLEGTGVGTAMDVYLLRMLCDLLSDYSRSRERGAPYSAGNWRAVLRLSAEFGLTPSSRTRLLATPPQAPDPFERYLPGRRPAPRRARRRPASAAPAP
jgi:phage terminase small subunit